MWDLIVSVPDHCLSFYFVTGSLLIQESKPGTKDCQSNKSQSRRRTIVYCLSWQPQTIGNFRNERGARIHFCIFSPSKGKIPPKIFFIIIIIET